MKQHDSGVKVHAEFATPGALQSAIEALQQVCPWPTINTRHEMRPGGWVVDASTGATCGAEEATAIAARATGVLKALTTIYRVSPSPIN